MGQIRAEFSILSAAEEYFQQRLWQFESVLDNLERELEADLARWEDDARTAYRVAHSQWDKSAREVAAELARLRKVIERSRRNFENSSETNVRMWSV